MLNTNLLNSFVHRSMTLITMNGDFKKVNQKMLTGYHLLKFVAFSTNLVELLGEGLRTYANEKYVD